MTTVLTKVVQFDQNVAAPLSLGVGLFNIDVTVYDAWGATTVVTIPTPVIVRLNL